MKISFLIIIFSFITSSVYAHPQSCPEAGLSDEQEAQWKGLREDFRASVEGLNRKERRAKRAEFHQQVLDTVPATDDQRAALEQCFERRRGCPEAGLSDEQEAQWKELREDFKASVEGLNREERRAKRAAFHQQVLDTVPATDDQRAALEQCFERRRGCPEAGLSDEQKAQWKGLREDFRASVEGLNREERRAKRAEFHQQVLDTVSATDDQRTALERCLEKRKEHRKRRGEKHE